MEPFVVSCCSNGTFVWSATSTTVHLTLKANAPSSAVILGSRGDYLLSAQLAKPAIHVYALPGEAPVQKCPVAEKLSVLGVSETGFLFGGSETGRLYVWSVASGALLNVIDAHYNAITAIAVTRDGAAVVTAGNDSNINVWFVSSLIDGSSRTPSPHHTWSGHGLKVTALHCAVGPQGETVVLSGSLDCTVKMWKLPEGNLIADVAFPRPITAVTMDAFEQSVFAGAQDGTIFSVNFYGSQIAKTMAFSEAHEKDQDEDDENDNDVVMGNNSNNNSNNDGGGGSGDVGFSKLLAHKGAVTSLVVVGRGTEQLLISGSLDGQIHMWDVRSGQLTLSFKKHTSGVKSMSVFWADAACNFPERKNCLVGRLQKFQWSKETVQPVPLWVNPSMCVVHDESASSRVHSLLRRQGSSSKSALSSSGTKRGDRGDEEQQVVTAQAKRIDDLERQVAQLSATNQRLFEFNVEKTLATADVKKLKTKNAKGRYFGK